MNPKASSCSTNYSYPKDVEKESKSTAFLDITKELNTSIYCLC